MFWKPGPSPSRYLKTIMADLSSAFSKVCKKFEFSYLHKTRKEVLPPFSLIRDFRKQNIRGNVSQISVNHTLMLSTDRIEIHQPQPANMT